MVRDFSRDFEGRCCEDDFGTCDWTCKEIQQRIDTRAPRGLIYTRSEIDSRIAAIESIANAAFATVRVILNAADPTVSDISPAGYLWVNTTEDDLFVSEGAGTWKRLTDYDEFVSRITDVGTTGNTIDITDIMQKSVYDDPIVVNQNNAIRVEAGGLNADNSASQGIVTFQTGTPTITDNYKPLRALTMTGDVILTALDAPVQVLSTSVDRDTILPVSPSTYVHYRIINKLQTNTITVRDDIGGAIVYTLESANTFAADFHWDGIDWNVIALTLV